jgi:hypothetical protein
MPARPPPPSADDVTQERVLREIQDRVIYEPWRVDAIAAYGRLWKRNKTESKQWVAQCGIEPREYEERDEYIKAVIEFSLREAMKGTSKRKKL